MAKNIIKAGVSDKYFVEAAAIFCNENERTPEIKSERKYEGMLLIRQKVLRGHDTGLARSVYIQIIKAL